MTKIKINPKVLEWARTRSNYSLPEVAGKFKNIKSWEEGRDYPTYPQLEKLASKYKIPIAIFFFPEPPTEDNIQKSFRTLPQEEIESLSPSLLKIIRQSQAMQIKLSELCNGENPARNPMFKEVSFAINHPINELRNYFSISVNEQAKWKSFDEAFDNWRNLIENHGIFVFKDPFKYAFEQDKISGFCLYDDEFPIICVNNSMTKTRQIFTLFHELSHLLFKTGGIDKLRDDYISLLSADNRGIENFCNKFAGNFLVPDDNFNKRINNKSIDEKLISNLSDLYKVSREVILRKLLDRDLVSREYYEQKSQKWAAQRKKKGTGGDYYLNQITYLGKNYLKLVFGQYYKKHIPLSQLAEYLNVKIDNVPKLEIAFHKKL